MSLDQLKAFLRQVRDDTALRQAVQAAAIVAEVAQFAGTLGDKFSGVEPPRLSGQQMGRVMETKQGVSVASK
jgi:predicted ribosomally synthesized peptide with nif11-like leader